MDMRKKALEKAKANYKPIKGTVVDTMYYM